MLAAFPLQHGEVMLVPTDDTPSSAMVSRETRVVVAHSESGHHHVLECDTPMTVHRTESDLFVRLFAPGRLVHMKAHDQHQTLEADAVCYRIVRKREYRPFSKMVEMVRD